MSALLVPTWDELAVSRPVLAATMCRYLQQVACSLRSAVSVMLTWRCGVSWRSCSKRLDDIEAS